MAMTETELVEEASSAWDDGRRSDALQLMKRAVRKDPSLLDIRRSLAERYRQMGHPDQAGRWGIVFDGWTSDFERDRLARLLAASRISEAETARFLVLNRAVLPEDVTDSLRVSVVNYRSKFERSALDRHTDEPSTRSNLADLAAPAWGMFVVATVVGAFVTFGFAVFGSVGRVETRVGALFLVGFLTYALLCSAVLAIDLKSRKWALLWGLSAVVAAFVTMLYGVNGWIHR